MMERRMEERKGSEGGRDGRNERGKGGGREGGK